MSEDSSLLPRKGTDSARSGAFVATTATNPVRGATIYALASGAPPAAIAVIRISGPDALAATAALAGRLPPPRRASLRRLRDPASGDLLDEALVLVTPGPNSFTGEDSAELQLHGGRAVVAAVLGALARCPGLRLAEPGEFTRRALENGTLDLTEVEGLADLIVAETEAQRRQAVRQSAGALARAAEAWRQDLLALRALVEAELDFVDESDVPDDAAGTAWPGAAALAAAMEQALEGAGAAERLRDGLEVVILGPPNAGKSSLLNALARREVAIVTPEPGTTRDLIEVRLDCAGYPVTLVDSAGLRETEGLVEREGIARARRRAEAADLVLWLTEDGERPPDLPGDVPVWPILTKVDALPSVEGAVFHVKHAISAHRGDGLADLERALARFAGERFCGSESALVTRARQQEALGDCVSHLREAAERDDLPLELRAEALRRAGDALARLTGHLGVEDVLGAIFSSFCIGK